MTAMNLHDHLEAHYAGLEAGYVVVDEPSYAPLVTANGNDRLPIHRWFRMKEAYSSRLLEHVMESAAIRSRGELRLFDPFSGSGTTAVSAGDMVRDGKLTAASATAVEVNPFLHMLSAAKVSGHTSVRRDVLNAAGSVARRAMSMKDGVAGTPSLTTFGNEEYFPAQNLMKLLALRASISAVHKDSDVELTRFLTVALAAAVEPSSNLRRDGRALRLTPGKAAREPIDVFLDAAGRISEDLARRPIPFRAEVTLGDIREPELTSGRDDDISVYSPPYPNNIDYTEVYKMEGWLLGLYENAADVTTQRRKTLRSHSSLRWGSEYRYALRPDLPEIESLLAPLLAAIPSDQYRRGREEVVRGYVDDMLATIGVVSRRLRTGGTMAIVVGNSMHGKSPHDYVIASDLLLARLAELEGFSIESIMIARYPRRRVTRSRYLRESVVIARKD